MKGGVVYITSIDSSSFFPYRKAAQRGWQWIGAVDCHSMPEDANLKPYGGYKERERSHEKRTSWSR